jgi:NADH:ubiquinone oxidoreductase subunit 6 (subunit J)
MKLTRNYIMKLTRLFTVLFGAFIPIYILVIFLPIFDFFTFELTWLPETWTESTQFWYIMAFWVAPILFCAGWIYFMIMFGKRLAATLELMLETSSTIATHYIIFYGVCAIVMLISFLLPLFTPIVTILSLSSVIFKGLTSRVTWQDLDEKTKKVVKILTVIIDIPIIFITILVLPEIMVYSWDFFQSFWNNMLEPLYLLMRAIATALPIGNFMLLYRHAIQEVEGVPDSKYQGNTDVILVEMVIASLLFFLAMNKIPFVDVLYYIGAIFWFISFISNLIKGKRAKNKFGSRGKNPQSVLSMLLFAVFYVATLIFGQTENISPTFTTVRYIVVGGAAFVFMVIFLLIFAGHPALDED